MEEDRLGDSHLDGKLQIVDVEVEEGELVEDVALREVLLDSCQGKILVFFTFFFGLFCTRQSEKGLSKILWGKSVDQSFLGFVARFSQATFFARFSQAFINAI